MGSSYSCGFNPCNFNSSESPQFQNILEELNDIKHKLSEKKMVLEPPVVNEINPPPINQQPPVVNVVQNPLPANQGK